MSRSAATLLSTAYGVDPRRVESSRTASRTCPSSPPRREAAPRPGRPRRHPELRPARPGQGLRARDRCAARRSSPRIRTRCYVIVGATHPDLDPARGRGVSRVADRPRRRPGHDRPRPVRRPVRRPRRTDPLARGGRRLRHALPQHGPDRVGHAVLRDGRGPGRSSRRRTRMPRSCSPTAAASSSRPGRRSAFAAALNARPRRRPSCAAPSAGGPTSTAGG